MRVGLLALAAACFKKREVLEKELAAAVEKIRENAKERMVQGKADPTQKIEEGARSDRETNAARAKLAGTNRQYIHDADTLAEKAPGGAALTAPPPSGQNPRVKATGPQGQLWGVCPRANESQTQMKNRTRSRADSGTPQTSKP